MSGQAPSSKPEQEVKRKGADHAATAQPVADKPGTTTELLTRLGAGMPLDADSRTYFEPRLGRDLGGVRIHTDAAAAEAARQLSARAFTFGNHIAFAEGEYKPDSENGRRLLAHELAHVLQNNDFELSDKVQREVDPRYKDPNDISQGAIDPAKHKAAESTLQTLHLPAIKARHLSNYQARAGKSLRRPAGFDRSKPEYSTKQTDNWNKAIKVAQNYAKIKFDPAAAKVSLPFYGNKNKSLDGSGADVEARLKIPNWTPDGNWQDAPLQVDHIVEMQVYPEGDNIENYELLTGAHNMNAGGLLKVEIYSNVGKYLDMVGKTNSQAKVKEYLDKYEVKFTKVEGGGEGKHPESSSQFWSRGDIEAGKHFSWLIDEKRDPKADGNDKTRFALYSATGNGFIDVFPLNNNIVTTAGNTGRLSGIAIDSITLKPGFDTMTGGEIGTLAGSWKLPANIRLTSETKITLGINKSGDKKYAGALSPLPAVAADIKGASPVEFKEISLLRGQVFGDGVLKPSLSLLQGVEIPVQWRGGDVRFEYTVSSDALKGKLPVPGIQIDDTSLTLFFDKDGLGAEGAVQFTITKMGTGELRAGMKSGKDGPLFSMSGSMSVDRTLFDQAQIKLAYNSEDGVSGSGTLAITQKGKIKGVKSANVEAGFKKNEFWAKGGVEPDVPGLKNAAVAVSYQNEALTIAGDVGLDEKVPGVQAADIHVEIKQDGGAWKVSASGQLTPKIKGLDGAQLTFSYKDGFVLMEGTLNFAKGPFSGTVTCGVTNASVDEKTGTRGETGEGRNFKIFGNADINAKFTDKLGGTIKLVVKPNGSILIGGAVTVADTQIFPQFPAGDDAKHTLLDIHTPQITLVGITFGGVGAGIVFFVTGKVEAAAAVGPGSLKNTKLEVAPFDPVNFNIDSLKISGNADFEVPAFAELSVSADVNLALSALVFQIGGSVGVTAKAGIPADPPAIKANTHFTWSQQDGFDITSTLKIAAQPQLSFLLSGKLFAHAELLVKTITLWEREWALGEATFKLPIGINASASMGYNSKKGFKDFKPEQAITFDKPKLEASDFKDMMDGRPSQQTVNTTNQDGTPVENDQGGVCAAPPEPNACTMPPADDAAGTNSCQMPPPVSRKPASGGGDGQDNQPRVQVGKSHDPHQGADDPQQVIAALGDGEPLAIATRGFFEQRMHQDFSAVRIHVGPLADRAARKVSARAFTTGQHIVFANGEFQPQTEPGKALLAHELAHVQQQQAGARRKIMRQVPAGTAPAPAAAATAPPAAAAGTTTPAGAAPAGTTPAATSAPAAPAAAPSAAVTAARQDLENLQVPTSKQRHAHLYRRWLAEGKLKHGPNYDRDGDPPAQVSQWNAQAGTLASLEPHFVHLGLTPTLSAPKQLQFRSGHTETKTRGEWLEYFRVPQWDRQATWMEHRMEVDHVVELQTAGWPAQREGDTVENYELLDKSTNASSGGTVYNGLVRKMRALLQAERNVAPGAVSREDAQSELRTRGVVFHAVSGGGGHRDDRRSAFWTMDDIRSGRQFEAIQVAGNAGETGSPTNFGLMSAAGGIVVGNYHKRADQTEINVTGPGKRRMAGLSMDRISLNANYTSAAVGDAIGSVVGTWVLPTGFDPQNAPFTFTLHSASQYSGYLEPTDHFDANAHAMSPVVFNGIAIDGAALSAHGQLRPSIPLLNRTPIDVRWHNGEIQFGKTFTANDLNIALPGLNIDAASVGVFFGPEGFNAEGGIDFTINHLGTGALLVGVDSRGKFQAEGSIHVDTSVFDRAALTLWYRDGEFGGSGELAITQPNRVRGVRSASVSVSVDGQHIHANGQLQPTIPGVQNAALTADYAPDTGLDVSGDLQLQNLPGIREGSVHAELKQQNNLWKLSAHGQAIPNLPGVDSAITIAYDDGAFDGTLTVAYSRGIFSGSVTVGVTNRAVNPDGEVAGGPQAAPAAGGAATSEELSIYGSGNVNARLTEWLQGGVGIKIKPTGELLISGRIGIPSAVTVFDQYPSEEASRRELFHMPTVSVPLVGISVAGHTVGIALVINGRVTAYAHIGPGQLTQAELRIEDFNPAEPDTLHIAGDARFNVPAAAGVEASIDAGVSAGAVVLDFNAGINVAASVGVTAHVTPSVHMDWAPATGLHLHADLDAALSPRLHFSVNGYAEVIADALVTTFTLWRKEWNLAEREFGSNLAIGVNAPVDYYSDGRGVVFDPNRVSFQVPPMNGDTLSGLFNNEGSEHVEDREG